SHSAFVGVEEKRGAESSSSPYEGGGEISGKTLCQRERGEIMADVFTLYKLIVLYMAQQSKEELTNSQISEFVLDREYTDYFHLQQVLSELVETGLLKKRTVSNSSHYEITEEGSRTFYYFEKDLSAEIKKEIDE